MRYAGRDLTERRKFSRLNKFIAQGFTAGLGAHSFFNLET